MLRPASPNAVPFGLTQVFVVPAGSRWRAERGGVEPRGRATDSQSVIGSPVTSARSEPLTPRSMSRLLPSTRGVYQRPLAMVKSPLSDHALRMCDERATLQEAMTFAERQFGNPIAGEFVSLVEAREAAVGGDVERILRHDDAASTDR